MQLANSTTHLGTTACADYVQDQSDALKMFVAALELAEEGDRPPAVLADELAQEPDPFMAFRSRYDGQIGEDLLTRAVDRFLRYLADVLALVYEANPSALPETVIPVSLSAELENRGGVIREMTGRRVRALSRKGIESLSRPFRILGCPLFRLAPEGREIGRIIAQRDVIVHSQGVVDRSYRRRVPASRAPLGTPLVLTRSDAVDDSLLLANAAIRVDRAAVERWKFDTVEIVVGSPKEVTASLT